jgi:hypothetical protein
LEDDEGRRMEPLRDMITLEELDITGWKSLTDLKPLEGLRELKSLKLSGTGVWDLSPLRKLKLSSLDLSNCKNLADAEEGEGAALEPLRGMTTLEYINII